MILTDLSTFVLLTVWGATCVSRVTSTAKARLASGCPVGLLQLLCCLLAGGADVIAEGHPAAKDKFHFGGGFPARWPQLLHAPKRKSSDGLQP
ncbi:hypothetical protein GN956_G11145 [Arapaima gigas]